MSNAFRPLNDNEFVAINRAILKDKINREHPIYVSGSLATISYERMPGGFCVCIVLVPMNEGYLAYRGASRRSSKDPRNDIRGEMLAFNRALLYSRPTEIG